MRDKKNQPPGSSKPPKPCFVLSRKPKKPQKPQKQKATKKKTKPVSQLPDWTDEFCFADVHDRIMGNYYDAQRRDEVAESNYGRLQDGKIPSEWQV